MESRFVARTCAALERVWLTPAKRSLYGQLVFTISLGHRAHGSTVQMLAL